MKIVIPDKIVFTESQLDRLKALDATIYEDMPKDEAEIIERIKDAEIITANYIDITPKLIDSAVRLKHIVVPAVGYEWVDVSYAATKGIKVSNCPAFNSLSVAELALSFIFAISRKIVSAGEDLKQGRWNPRGFSGTELAGKHLGMIGHGHVGKLIEQKATALGMTVSYADSKSSNSDIDQLIVHSDYLVLCAQLNDKTRHLMNARRLALMKPTSYLINVARGAIVEQAALTQSLKSRKIAGAALDVFDIEPLVGKPSADIVELASLPNVVATPHIGATTEEADTRLGEEVVASILAAQEGHPVNVVDL
jgi:phosphoglycerate dehydrogenase-like enzyme